MSNFSRGGGSGGGGGAVGRAIQVILYAPVDDIATGTDLGNFAVPSVLNNKDLGRVVAYVTGTVGAGSGTTDVMLYNTATSQNMLSGSGASIPTAGTSGAGTVIPAQATVATDQIIRVDVTGVSTPTKPKGLVVLAEFEP